MYTVIVLPAASAKQSQSSSLMAKSAILVGSDSFELMQAAGLTNDHLVSCHRHDTVRRLGHRVRT